MCHQIFQRIDAHRAYLDTLPPVFMGRGMDGGFDMHRRQYHGNHNAALMGIAPVQEWMAAESTLGHTDSVTYLRYLFQFAPNLEALREVVLWCARHQFSQIVFPHAQVGALR